MTTTTRKTARKSPALKVGDKVRLLKATRHNMVAAGTIGEVVEIHGNDRMFPGAVSVVFMIQPNARIALMFGKDPNALDAHRCMFPVETVARMLSIA